MNLLKDSKRDLFLDRSISFSALFVFVPRRLLKWEVN